MISIRVSNIVLFVAILGTILFLNSPLKAADMVEQGGILFNDPALAGSLNNKSCNSCHPGGRGITSFQGNRYALINKCIVNQLNGKELDTNVQEDLQKLRALSAYISSVIHATALDLGRQLFNDPSLAGSTNDKSCNSCHPGRAGLKMENINSYDEIVAIVNRCIVNALKGTALKENSPELKALIDYIVEPLQND